MKTEQQNGFAFPAVGRKAEIQFQKIGFSPTSTVLSFSVLPEKIDGILPEKSTHTSEIPQVRTDEFEELLHQLKYYYLFFVGMAEQVWNEGYEPKDVEKKIEGCKVNSIYFVGEDSVKLCGVVTTRPPFKTSLNTHTIKLSGDDGDLVGLEELISKIKKEARLFARGKWKNVRPTFWQQDFVIERQSEEEAEEFDEVADGEFVAKEVGGDFTVPAADEAAPNATEQPAKRGQVAKGKTPKNRVKPAMGGVDVL